MQEREVSVTITGGACDIDPSLLDRMEALKFSDDPVPGGVLCSGEGRHCVPPALAGGVADAGQDDTGDYGCHQAVAWLGAAQAAGGQSDHVQGPHIQQAAHIRGDAWLLHQGYA